ncbi:MAG: ubiquinol-cytochrome c reductase iron-sulfur subunit [Solirubrobacterales bacterium]|nr:ubiquinol-cytochrome c reductase iron-sulfur subunit [Solirubrobacterales bacterium]
MASRLWKALVVLVLWAWGALRPRRRARARRREVDPSRRDAGSPAWVERTLLGLLAAIPLSCAAFAVLYILDPNTQLLGLALGAALALLAAALILAGKRLLPQETKVEERPIPGDRQAVDEVLEQAHAATDGITRRGLLLGAAGAAGAGLTAAVAVPVVALGPGIEDQLSRTPWHAGRALVDEQGAPLAAAAIREGSFVTAFPEGADKENLDAPVVLVRVDPASLRASSERAGWAPMGILAYSKICTHAACAISLYRAPLSPSTQSRGPALVCPCHYSTFDVLDSGRVEFGPAGRPLPQLPLSIDAQGTLRAAGPLSGPVGPSWWGDAR